MTAIFAHQVLDGAMLSDANLYPCTNAGEQSKYINSFCRIQLGGSEQMDWLSYLSKRLE